MTRRRLSFYDPASTADLEAQLRSAMASGTGSMAFRGPAAPAWIEDAVARTGLRRFRDTPADESVSPDGCELVVVPPGEDDAVSAALLALLPADVAVLAPVTGHHFSRRVVYLFSIPKAGTHMMLRLFDLMGLKRSPDRHPEPGTWCTPVGYQYHAPCRELLAGDWFEPVGRQLFLRSPGVFVYRHPLDIVVSELDWFVKPEHAFSDYLNGIADEEGRLQALIADATVMGSIRDRILRYSGWIRFPNLCAVSYEELVGCRGGGSDSEQFDTIWSLLLKLQIPGDVRDLAGRLYDPGSATFSRGRIGRHIERFTPEHLAAVASLPQDFLDVLGYRPGEPMSSHVVALRARPLRVKRLSPEQLYTARLVREAVGTSNIVEIAGRYYRVSQGRQILTAEDARALAQEDVGFATIDDALGAMDESQPTPEADAPVGRTAFHLTEEGFLDFNILHDGETWVAARQSAGPLDLDKLDEQDLSRLEAGGLLLRARTDSELRDRILAGTVIAFRTVESAVMRRMDSAAAELEPLRGAVGSLSARLAEELDPFRSEMAGLSRQVQRVERGLAQWLPADVPEQGLVLEGFAGFNLVRMKDRWLAVDQALGPLDLTTLGPERKRELEETGALASGTTIVGTLGRVLERYIECLVGTDTALADRLTRLENQALALVAHLESAESAWRRGIAESAQALEALSAKLPLDPSEDGVFESGYLGFAILRAWGKWYGVKDGQGPVPTAESMSTLAAAGLAVEGSSVVAVKAAILRNVLSEAVDREQALAEALRAAVKEIREHRHGRVE
jgi:hypothetical protein